MQIHTKTSSPTSIWQQPPTPRAHASSHTRGSQPKAGLAGAKHPCCTGLPHSAPWGAWLGALAQSPLGREWAGPQLGASCNPALHLVAWGMAWWPINVVQGSPMEEQWLANVLASQPLECHSYGSTSLVTPGCSNCVLPHFGWRAHGKRRVGPLAHPGPPKLR